MTRSPLSNRMSKSSLCLVFALAMQIPAHAQRVREHGGQTLRGFHGTSIRPGAMTRSFQSDAEAEAEFARILAAVGLTYLSDRITLRASADTPNAAAFIENGERLIFYNADFMQKLKRRTAEQWTLVSILAHELGHHLAFHTEVTGNDHKYELEADYFSGFVLRRLGASLAQSQLAMETIGSKVATRTHPALADRLQVITIGWTDGGQPGTPRGLSPVAAAPRLPQQQAAVIPPKPQQLLSLPMPAAPAVATVPPPVSPSNRPVCDPQSVKARGAAREAATKDCLEPLEVFRDCVECPALVVIPPGAFTMGSNDSANEKPIRRVTITAAFGIGRTVITVQHYTACVAAGKCPPPEWQEAGGKFNIKTGTDTGYKKFGPALTADDHPIVGVSWDNVRTYAAWLTEQTGFAYRLPSEVEWEYAARGGKDGAKWWWGKDFNANNTNGHGRAVRDQWTYTSPV